MSETSNNLPGRGYFRHGYIRISFLAPDFAGVVFKNILLRALKWKALIRRPEEISRRNTGESSRVINAVLKLHGEANRPTVEAVLVAAADL
jgi:hypothetical protein